MPDRITKCKAVGILSDRMQTLRVFFGLCLAVLVMIGMPGMAHAASSNATRAIDDVAATTKDYSGQNLIRAEFAAVRLPNSNFSNADLRGAVFSGSDLRNSNWSGADFSDGIAYITDLSGADLTDTVLTSAMMIGSVLKGAKITGADFSFAVLDRPQVVELCKTASGVNSKTGISTRESLECP
ncbi:pentapeptide repeat-containing protein [Leptolyngbya boryana CZ1]|uniref:Pentapeptide repeat-containing protein n=2 Tax=Leptolyngbya TaxID=47251 RepID=A0AA96WYD2_LEPBY|nr:MULTISPECIES: pentapeptide repeat-containing protein [Leptolyngbya]WNZ47742.1 pentapeptide repeat-containing protein [Leptolyngbya boryana CZ1]